MSVRQAEAALAQVLLQFEQMLPPGLGTMCVVFKQLRIGAHLVGNKSQHRRWQHFRRFERAAGVPKGAQLRAVFPQTQASPCYRASMSDILRA